MSEIEAPKRPKWRLILFVVIVALLVALSFTPPVKSFIKDYVGMALEWTDSLGAWGPAFVAVFYIIACVLLLPGGILTIGAGFLFGLFVGTITVSIGSTLGACAAFVVGRYFARGWVEKKVSEHPKFAALDEAIGAQGFKIVLLTRLSPIFPFNFQNYAYGLTKVKLRHYALASWIGMLPGTVAYIYIGSAAKSLTDVVAGKVEGGMTGKVFFWAGLVVSLLVVAYVTKVATAAFKQAVGNNNTAGGQGETS